MEKLGWTDSCVWHDLLATEDWALEMIPRPVRAVVCLFPITEKSEAYSAEEAARIAAAGQHVDPTLYFMLQTIDVSVQ